MREKIIDRQIAVLEEALEKFVSIATPYALLDFPDYSNVGDSAIWVGAMKLLRGITGRNPDYVCTWRNYDSAELARTTGPIFILGGGNFGDLYPNHLRLRSRLMSDFPERVIVQLPQSIHFDKSETVNETASSITRHGNFHLLVRDLPSEAFAKDNFTCPVSVAPDCAVALGPLKCTRRAEHPVLCLLRSDNEQAGNDYGPIASGAPVYDWVAEPPLPKFRGLSSIAASALRGTLNSQGIRLARYNAAAATRLRRGLDLLCRGELIVTDRLHGHLLSVLLGIPDVALDNRTGKVSAYHHLWLSDLASSVVTDNVQAAARSLDHLRQSTAPTNE